MTRLFEQLGTVVVATVVLTLTCAYIAYGAERHAGNRLFGSYEDALWWASVTMTTVGYGDIYPKTPVGRTAGVILMLAGLAVLGVLAGALASFFGIDPEASKPKRARAGEGRGTAALDDQAVTVRERDTMSQERISLDAVTSYFAERFVGC